ncbi:MAG: hypothetical protein K6F04_03225 [bacterium]|nr:hypothetical protein [bacterium]
MKKIITLALLLTLSFTAKAGYIESPSVYACGSCFIKLPENLSRKSFDYVMDISTVYDEDGKFIGLGKIEKALNDAGFKDYKIKTFNSGSTVYFNIITDEKNADLMPLVMTNVDGVSSMKDKNLITYEDDIYATTSYTTCRQKAYDNAMKDLQSHGVVGNEFDITLDDASAKIGYYSDDMFQVQVCLEAVETE